MIRALGLAVMAIFATTGSALAQKPQIAQYAPTANYAATDPTQRPPPSAYPIAVTQHWKPAGATGALCLDPSCQPRRNSAR